MHPFVVFGPFRIDDIYCSRLESISFRKRRYFLIKHLPFGPTGVSSSSPVSYSFGHNPRAAPRRGPAALPHGRRSVETSGVLGQGVLSTGFTHLARPQTRVVCECVRFDPSRYFPTSAVRTWGPVCESRESAYRVPLEVWQVRLGGFTPG